MIGRTRAEDFGPFSPASILTRARAALMPREGSPFHSKADIIDIIGLFGFRRNHCVNDLGRGLCQVDDVACGYPHIDARM